MILGYVCPMKPLYPIIGRITWMLGKRAAKRKLPSREQGNKALVAGVTVLVLGAVAVAMLRNRGE